MLLSGAIPMPPVKGASGPTSASSCDGSAVATASAQWRGSLTALAASAGVSRSQLYRLIKDGDCGRSRAAVRILAALDAPPITARVLDALGFGDLIGTASHRYLDRFLVCFAVLLRELNESDPDMVDPRWAEGSAKLLIQQLVIAAHKRAELADKLQNELWSTR